MNKEDKKLNNIYPTETTDKELNKEINPYYVPSTQACMPDEYKTLSNNPYIKYGNKHSFTDEDVDYDKE